MECPGLADLINLPPGNPSNRLNNPNKLVVQFNNNLNPNNNLGDPYNNNSLHNPDDLCNNSHNNLGSLFNNNHNNLQLDLNHDLNKPGSQLQDLHHNQV